MNEADRVAAERAAAAQRQRQHNADTERRNKLGQIEALAREAQQLIPSALQAKARNKYSGIQQIDVYSYPSGIGRIFSSSRKRQMGAYQLSYIDLGEGGWGSRGFAIFLASDGHLVAGSSLETVKEFADKVRQHEGLAPSKYGTYSLRELYSIRMFSSAVAKLREIARNG